MAERTDLQKAMDKVLSTDAGLEVFKHLHRESGYNAAFYDRNNPSNTTYNLGRRDLWLDLRRHISPQHLSLIEIPSGE